MKKVLDRSGGKCQIVAKENSKVEEKQINYPENSPVIAGFVGHFRHSLDPKKRLTIPSEWREQVGEPAKLYILPGLHGDQCLYVYPAHEMAPHLEKLRKRSIGDKKARIFARMLASRSELVFWDAQGRIRIKDELLKFAELKSHVELIGTWDHFELWSLERWKQASSVSEDIVEDAVRYVDF